MPQGNVEMPARQGETHKDLYPAVGIEANAQALCHRSARNDKTDIFMSAPTLDYARLFLENEKPDRVFFERMSADRREDLPMKMHVELAHCRTTDGCGTLRRVNAYPAACRLIRSCLSDRMNRRMAPGIASKSDPWPLDKLCSKPIYLGANVQGKFLGDLPAYLVTKCTEFHF